MTTPQTLEEALPCTCGTGTDSHSEGCPAHLRPAIQAWHEAQVEEWKTLCHRLEYEYGRLWEEKEAAESQVAEKDARIEKLEAALRLIRFNYSEAIRGSGIASPPPVVSHYRRSRFAAMTDIVERLRLHGQHNGHMSDTAVEGALVCQEAADEIERLRGSYSEVQNEIQQVLGKALGYPWFKDDQKNFSGATEDAGVCVGDHVAESIASEAAAVIARLRGIEKAARECVVGWREWDWPECFDRRTAEIIAEKFSALTGGGDAAE